MKHVFVLSALMLSFALSGVASAQATKPTTQPADKKADASIEVRAFAAFDKGDYNTALPLLMVLANQAQDNPKKQAAIQEKIRVAQQKVMAKATPQDLQDLAGQRPADTTSPEKRKKHTKPKDGEAYDLLIKDLGNFDYDAEKGGNIPDDVKKLTGSKIRTRGFMIPLDQADNITEFALVPSLFACCFGQPPQVQHTLVVKTPKGKAVSYFPEEIVVEGALKVDEKKEDGIIISVFEMECNSVKPAGK